MAYNVIVADPSFAVQKTAQLIFPEPEFKVFPFEDGLEVLEAVKDIRPDALLLGVSLSGKDGYEVARSFQSRPDLRQVPIFFLRGTFEPFDMEKAAGIDIEDIVQKPFDSGKLAVKIRELVEKKMSPATLPEEPFWEDSGPAELPSGRGGDAAGGLPDASSSRGAGRPDLRPDNWAAPDDGPSASRPAAGLTADQRNPLSPREILDMEREIEKRVRARVLSEVRGWLDEEKARIKARS